MTKDMIVSARKCMNPAAVARAQKIALSINRFTRTSNLTLKDSLTMMNELIEFREAAGLQSTFQAAAMHKMARAASSITESMERIAEAQVDLKVAQGDLGIPQTAFGDTCDWPTAMADDEDTAAAAPVLRVVKG